MTVNLKPGKGPGQSDLKTTMKMKTATTMKTSEQKSWRNDSAIFHEKVSKEGRTAKRYKKTVWNSSIRSD